MYVVPQAGLTSIDRGRSILGWARQLLGRQSRPRPSWVRAASALGHAQLKLAVGLVVLEQYRAAATNRPREARQGGRQLPAGRRLINSNYLLLLGRVQMPVRAKEQQIVSNLD
jgi:hypothetical protein